ncbi:glucose-methanol-choline oxidoreductase [Planoprotostelium fungivorum]|uniref:Glucose-methanol-choline oxidoreductase n=1 Tax=Planoprotostelium fungivorum TaxID=1890364 RepID=A0A2P6NER3_9EUKA|nr:glucose-methanol-choline oxidoreductase [Planoprotostelium fungivorum]
MRHLSDMCMEIGGPFMTHLLLPEALGPAPQSTASKGDGDNDIFGITRAVAILHFFKQHRMTIRAVLCLLAVVSTLGQLFSRYPVYDYVVVGGGGAGSLWAARLSETKNTVLVLEQGPNATCYKCDNTVLNDIDDLWTSHGNSLFTTPQGPAQRSFKQIKMSRPGGNTRIYQGVAYPAHPGVYRQYPGNLTYEKFLPYYAKFQNHYCNYLNQSITGISPADCLKYHGTKSGPMGIARPVTTYSDSAFFKALIQSAPEFGLKYLPDAWNGADQLNNKDGQAIFFQQHFRRVAEPANPESARVRESTWSGYTPYSVRARKNLTYKTETQAIRIIFRNEVNRGDFGFVLLTGFPNTNSPSTQAVGVLYQQGDQTFAVFARKQLVLAGGVLGTPKLLQQSGVGPADLLTSLGIPVVANNKYIGQNVADHPGFVSVFKAKKQLPVNLVNFGCLGTILLTTPFAKHGYPDIQVQLFPTFPITTFESVAGLSPLQLQYPPSPVANDTTAIGAAPILNFIICRTDPTVRGSYNITGTQYRYTSQLDLGWSTDFGTYAGSDDYQATRWVVNYLRGKLLGANATSFGKEWIEQELVPGIVDPAGQEYNDLLANAYNSGLTYHQTGGVDLGTATDIYGSVKGVTGITACDNSVQPHPPNQNPTGAMLALCEYVSEQLIQHTAGGPSLDDVFLQLAPEPTPSSAAGSAEALPSSGAIPLAVSSAPFFILSVLFFLF